jgi:outer membrane immunogenic protein
MDLISKPMRAAAVVATSLVAVWGSIGAAQADGMARGAPPVVQQAAPTSFSGFYFGAHSGWQWSQVDATFNSGSTFSVDHDSPVIGGQIGIQHQFGNFVLGVEGTLTVAYKDDHVSSRCPNSAYECAARFDDVITIGPRLGWVMGKWMPYLTGGYASAAFEEKIVNRANNVNSGALTASPLIARERHQGWYIGAGADLLVASDWVIGLEYRHYELDDNFYTPTVNLTGGGVGIGINSPNTADVSTDTVTLRVSWKLGRPAPVAPPLK